MDDEAIYHCISNCVRRAYLCGEDSLTGRNYNHRKDWVRDRLIFLTEVFSIDVLAYALMDTHAHTMLRTRPDLRDSLDDKQILERWQKLYPLRSPNDEQEKKMINETRLLDKKYMDKLRKRLTSISWFMKSLNEYIARKANKEDECKGRFWEGRFKCQLLADETALVTCSVYVDLNPIRAKMASTPEESEFTSIKERIDSIKEQKLASSVEPKLWISPIENNEDKKGYLPFSLIEYINLVDQTGREIRKDKRGAIPSNLAPILERIGINSKSWIETSCSFGKWFGTIVGNQKSLNAHAKRISRKWLKGKRTASLAFA